ncbi:MULTISPECIES: hypothetical protein [unclassified Streptomyces]|jgi:hypothetical protein|uniref:hypothetical protein n=1 Tax=unclassified Streptomyces TaxID=2593676 RepID=UPI0036E90761
MPEPTAALTEFIRIYEQATNSHDITRLVPLIARDAVYWFSDGSHRGREAVLSAISKTFVAASLECLSSKFEGVISGGPLR